MRVNIKLKGNSKITKNKICLNVKAKNQKNKICLKKHEIKSILFNGT